MDLIIPYKQEGDGLELKYTLRSIEKYLRHDKIFIVGDKPEWIKEAVFINTKIGELNSNGGVIHTPATDIPGKLRKQYNIYQKVLKACNDERVSDDFIFTNDDIYILQKIEKIKYWYEGELSTAFAKATSGKYKAAIKNTMRENGNLHYFDVHTPIVFNKNLFKQIFESEQQELVIKSMYCNHLILNGYEPYRDLKINGEFKADVIQGLIKGRLFFSTGPHGVNRAMREVLEKLFPDKSKYEAT